MLARRCLGDPCLDTVDLQLTQRYIHRSSGAVLGSTARASARVSALLPGLPPADGADALRRWQSQVDMAHLHDYVVDWLSRLNTADDYAAVLDVVAAVATSRPDEITAMDADIVDLIGRRQHRHLPDRGQWGWEKLARQQLATKPRSTDVIGEWSVILKNADCWDGDVV